ncbi:MAG: rhomboid family intramembrane serine protease [Flavobacteriales bacterium]
MATAAVLPFVAVVLMWSVFLLDHGLDLGLARFGILPREWSGLLGVLASPFLHGDFDHVFNNSVPVLLLGWCLMYFYPRIAGRVVLVSWLVGGFMVWLSARGNYHIGASGVVYSLAAFLFVSGMLRKQRTLMALSLLVTFLYGGLVWGVLPIVMRISWESHLWGGIVGVALAWVYRDVTPAVQDARPKFLDEEEEEEPDAPPALPVIYDNDPGDEVNDAELAWKRELARRASGSTSTTWDPQR